MLQLGSNQIASISSLQLSALTSLRTLFLNNNDITRVDGLEGLVNLQVQAVLLYCHRLAVHTCHTSGRSLV